MGSCSPFHPILCALTLLYNPSSHSFPAIRSQYSRVAAADHVDPLPSLQIIYVQNRRSWAAKTILTIMDVVILRVVLGIGVEFCTSKGRESLVEVFFIAWSIFLVTCKFVYLKTVFFMHQVRFDQLEVSVTKSGLNSR